MVTQEPLRVENRRAAPPRRLPGLALGPILLGPALLGLTLLALTMGDMAMAEDGQPDTGLVTASARPAEFRFDATATASAQPELAFATAELPGFLWFPAPERVEAFDATGVFERLDIRLRGYAPTDRDRFEVTILSARLRPERLAIASDIARMLLSGWADSIGDGIVHDGTDFGEAVGRFQRDGFDKTLRVVVWRRGASLLIVRAEMDSDRANRDFATLAPFLGSVRFAHSGTDPLLAAFRPWQIGLPGHAGLRFTLPPQWEVTMRQDPSGSGEDQAALMFVDQASPEGAGVLLVGLTEFPPAPFADIATAATRITPQFRQMATVISDTAVAAAQKPAGFGRRQMVQIGYEGAFAIGGASAEFKDALHWPDGGQLGADTLVAWRPEEVLALTLLMPWPETLPDLARMNHANFVLQHLIGELRGPFAPEAAP